MGDEDETSFNWPRWTLIGCLAWLVLAIATGGSTIAFILTPVAGPVGGWLVGGSFFLLAGVFGRRP
jgi:hypothetical protein